MQRSSRYIAAASLLAIFAIFLIYIFQISEEYPQKMQAAAQLCKVRSGPGYEFDVVATLSQDEVVIVLGMVETEEHLTWYRIDQKTLRHSVSSKEYYVRSDLLTLYGDTQK